MAKISNSRRRKVDVLALNSPIDVTKEKIIDIPALPTYEENDSVDTSMLSLSQLNSLSRDMPELISEECDACPYCADVCTDPLCGACTKKQNRLCCSKVDRKSQQSADLMQFPFFGNGTCEQNDLKFYTPCQIRRHCHESSAWLVCGDTIYDATKHIENHPGGRSSILRKSGGMTDCSVDLSFHSKRGQKMWKNCFVGKVHTCTGTLGKDGCDRDIDQCIIS